MVEGRARRHEPPPVFRRLEGRWRSHDYGTILELDRDGYRLYEETRVSCLLAYQGSLEDLAQFYVDVEVSPRRQAFSARRAAGVTRVHYRRLRHMPATHALSERSSWDDPTYNFEVFWHTFAERYALFDLRGVDWDRAYDRVRDQVGERTSAKTLHALFCRMLAPLRDGHVNLHAPQGHYSAAAALAVHRRLAAELGEDHSDTVAILDELQEQADSILHERYLGGRGRRACHGLLEWGPLDAHTGYLAVRAMAGHSGSLSQPRKDQHAAAAALRRMLGDIGALPRLVIDLRSNGGGYDGVALRLAGHFTDRKRLAFSKEASRIAGYGACQAIMIEPRGERRYHGHIVLLTSGLTASAAEIFVLALLRHPRVTRVGEATQGLLSDAMERHLPNGWRVTLSNELYRAADGALYEDRGIPPHETIRHLRPQDVKAGCDPMLDWVLAQPVGGEARRLPRNHRDGR